MAKEIDFEKSFNQLISAAMAIKFWEHQAKIQAGKMRLLAQELVELNHKLFTTISTAMIKAGYSENVMQGAILIGHSHAEDIIAGKVAA